MNAGLMLSVGALGLITMLGCRTPVYVEQDESTNFSAYKTYTWVHTSATQEDDSDRAVAYADIGVRNAVNAELRKSGWQETEENPDVLLSYDILVESGVERKSDPVYSSPFTRYYFNPRTRRWNSIYFPSQFMGYQSYEVPVKEGTITISIVDARTDKAVWQGWTTENMNYARFTGDEIARAVKNIFREFKPGS